MNSPYKDKLASVGLFMRQLEQSRAATAEADSQPDRQLPGDRRQRAAGGGDGGSAATGAQPSSIRLAALPLGGRVKIDPWSGRIELSKARPVAILNPREKKPFEITPVFPYLTRLKTSRAAGPSAPAAQTPPSPNSGAQ